MCQFCLAASTTRVCPHLLTYTAFLMRCRSHTAGDDEETSDTATSSASDTSESHQHHQQQRISLHKPRTAAAGEEDSITSSQPAPPASVAFSFGSRPYLTPDLSAVHCWDVMHGLLAAVSSKACACPAI